jgi:hypothetical protein
MAASRRDLGDLIVRVKARVHEVLPALQSNIQTPNTNWPASCFLLCLVGSRLPLSQ